MKAFYSFAQASTNPLDESKRDEWLKARHMRYGRDEKAAREWIDKTDAPNAALIRSTMGKASFIITP